jgi:hypothetical protein
MVAFAGRLGRASPFYFPFLPFSFYFSFYFPFIFLLFSFYFPFTFLLFPFVFLLPHTLSFFFFRFPFAQFRAILMAASLCTIPYL